MPPLRILIADDHPVFRYGLRALLAAEPDLELVGEAPSGEEALVLAATLQPDVILMDVTMPGLLGIEATRRILHDQPHMGIIILTMFDDDSVCAAMRAGARGYLLKGTEGEQTVQAIRAVGSGQAISSPAVAARLIAYVAAQRPSADAQAFPGLSEREREIRHLLAQGYTNAAIAQRLVLSPRTVRNHASNIFSKLPVAGRAMRVWARTARPVQLLNRR
jgi:DNA-binding NarL/FixJ family response regulator